MSYVPIADGALFDQADAVVDGRISAIDEGNTAVFYTVTVDDVIKGDVPAGSLRVFAPGALRPMPGDSAIVHGAPRFEVEESVVLFLSLRGDGQYTVMQLALGAFHSRHDAAWGEVLVRELSSAQRVADTVGPGKSDPEARGGVRNAAKFRAWLRAYAHGGGPPADYWQYPQGGGVKPPTAKYRLAGPPIVRWFEFDDGRAVDVYAGDIGLVGFVTGGYAAFRTAVDAWNEDSFTKVQLAYGGLTAALASLLSANGLNTIAFNDPYDDLPGSFNCSVGGLLATTVYHYNGASAFNGTTYARITEFDIVIQNGVGCLLSQHGGANAAEVFAHELGHGLGLGHSCGDSKSAACVEGSVADAALMRTTSHMDGRGALLGADDCAGLRVLYAVDGEPGQSDSCGGTWREDGGGALPPGTTLVMLLGLWLSRLRPRRRAGRSTGP